MPTPFLALNYKDGTTPQVRRYVGCTPTTQGVTFGSIETGSGTQDLCGQRVVRFLGHQTFVACVNTKIFRSTDAGATWTEVLSDANLGTNAAKGGPVLSYPGGAATLSILAHTGASSWRIFHSTDGSSWSSTSGINLISTNAPVQSLIQWRQSWYGVSGGGGSPRMFTWNPASLTAAVATFPHVAFTGATPHCLVVFNDRLFTMTTNSTSSGSLYLVEYVSGSWTTVQTIATGIGNCGAEAKWAMFVDGANMVGVAFATTGTSWRVLSWDSALNRTEITSAVDLAGVVGNPTSQTRIVPQVDGSDPGSGATPSIHLFHAANGTAGTPMTLLRWNGVNQRVTSIGTGGNVQHALPLGVQTGGSCFWTSGQRHIEKVSSTSATGGVRWGYRLYSPNGSPDNVGVRFNLAAASQEYPATPRATLFDPSSGTLSNANKQVDGVNSADNGSTLFEVTWLAEDDGFADGDFVKVAPEIVG